MIIPPTLLHTLRIAKMSQVKYLNESPSLSFLLHTLSPHTLTLFILFPCVFFSPSSPLTPFLLLLPSDSPPSCCRAVSCTGWPALCTWPAGPLCRRWEKEPPRGITSLWPESCAAQRWGGPTMHLCTHLQVCYCAACEVTWQMAVGELAVPC